MPYIDYNDRDKLNPAIKNVVEALGDIPIDIRPGAVNYTVTNIVVRSLVGCLRYHQLSVAIAVLKDAAVEMERRLMAKAEDNAIYNNGDIDCYSKFFEHKKDL